MIAVVNMGMGNILSVQNALSRIGLQSSEARTEKDFRDARAVILPGVGAFGAAMENLRAQGLVEPFRQIAKDGRIPILGVCLGMQLLADESEEHGLFEGLGIIPGRVVRLQEKETHNKVPNVGWCRTAISKKSSLFEENAGVQTFYYVHSYHMVPAQPGHIAATTLLGSRQTVAAVEAGTVAGVQFHPEKSQDDGLNLLFHWATCHGLARADAVREASA